MRSAFLAWFRERFLEPSGMRPIPKPPAGLSPLEEVDHYLSGYENDYFRTRRVVKSRANFGVLASAASSALVSVLGAIAAASSTDGAARVLSIIIAAVGAVATVIAAWDAHYSHRRHWIQKSAVLNALNLIRMQFEFRKSKGDDDLAVALETKLALDSVVRGDIDAWTKLQGRSTDGSTER